jgi:hypothetical protein
MRTTFCVQAFIGQSQPFHRPPTHQVLCHNLFRIFRLHMPVPDRVGIHHHRGPMLALVQAAGLVDAHLGAQPGLARKLLQPRMQRARSIAGARGPRRIGGAAVMTNKDVAFKWGQAKNLLSPISFGSTHSRLTWVPHISYAAADEMWESTNLNPTFPTSHESGCPRSLVRRGGGTGEAQTSAHRLYVTAPRAFAAFHNPYAHPGPICENGCLTMSTDNLLSLKDDMVAFIEGHGMRRLPGYVTDDIPSVLWEGHGNIDAWKDFVEMAKHVGSPFVTFSEMTLDHEELDALIEEAGEMNFPDEEAAELVEAKWLRKYAGKLGYIQLGFIYQGIVFMHETTTEWYERYQSLLENLEAFHDIVIDDAHSHDDEDE